MWVKLGGASSKMVAVGMDGMSVLAHAIKRDVLQAVPTSAREVVAEPCMQQSAKHWQYQKGMLFHPQK